jgi:GWxTD domain-containing protein
MRFRRRQFLCVFLFAAQLSTSCAAPKPVELTQTLAPRIPPERRDDLQITVFLADSGTRRAMRGTEDVGAWLDQYWLTNDPTPGTSRNEALDVYRQRADWLRGRFTETPFGEWPVRWQLYLRYGLPDAIGPEYIAWRRQNEAGRAQTPSSLTQATRERLRYRSPESFEIVLREGTVVRDPRQKIPDVPPSLEGDWEVLESPVSSVIDRRQALANVSWYELPVIAERLLKIPESRLMPLGELRGQAFTRLARRMAYRHGTGGTRRLAALSAVGADARLLLSRAAGDPYSAEALRADLERLSERRFRLPRTPGRGPHPDLWTDPEGLFDYLVRTYPGPTRLTGWNWEGDAHLALGPAALMDGRNRIAYYLWGTPEGLGIGETMLGWVEVLRLGDTLSDFVHDVETTAQERREQASDAAANLANVLAGSERGGETGSTEVMLRQLQELTPPNVFRAGIPRGADPIPLTMDIVGFPAGRDSVEVQVSFGIPAWELAIREEEQGYATDLRTNLVLVDHQLAVKHAITRQAGYRISGEGDIAQRVFLDTFRFSTVPGSYVAYLSAEDPRSGRSGGVLASIDLSSLHSEGLRISPIMLATDIQETTDRGKFVRGDLQILPVPSRQFFYGQDLHFYFEIDNLSRSEFGDCIWDESYYIIPEAAGEGIVRINPDDQHTSLQSSARRNMAIDLSSMAETYEGGVYLVVLVIDMVSNRQVVSATHFALRRPEP